MEYPDYEKCPVDIKEGLDDYIKIGLPPGGFLNAVLENDLIGAFGKADSNNMRNLLHICSYVYNRLPSNSWGSRDKVTNWLDQFHK